MMKNKKIAGLGIAVLLLVSLVVTCPQKDKHHEEVRMMVTNVLDKKILDAQSKEYGTLSALGSLFVPEMVDAFLNSRMKVDNYFIFSVGKVYYNGKSVTVSFGILGQVFALGQNEMEKSLERTLPGSSYPDAI